MLVCCWALTCVLRCDFCGIWHSAEVETAASQLIQDAVLLFECTVTSHTLWELCARTVGATQFLFRYMFTDQMLCGRAMICSAGQLRAMPLAVIARDDWDACCQ